VTALARSHGFTRLLAQVARGERLECAQLAQAAAAGRIGVGQAKAIGTVLGGRNELDTIQQAQAEALLLTMAVSMDAPWSTAKPGSPTSTPTPNRDGVPRWKNATRPVLA
jgi:hypothetical protein